MFSLLSVTRPSYLRCVRSASFSRPLTVLRRALASASGSRTPFLLTDIGEGIAEVEVLQFFVKEGDKVSQFQPLVEVQSDKATVEISSRYDGVIDALSYKPGDIAAVGSPLCYIRTDEAKDGEVLNEDGSEPKTEQGDKEDVNERAATGETNTNFRQKDRVLATPAVRGIARTRGVDICKIIGSGKDGRVTEEDVLRHLEAGSVLEDVQSAKKALEEPAEQSDKFPNEDIRLVEPIRGLRRGMMKSMTAAAEIAQLGLSDDVNMERATSLRRQILSQLGEDSQLRFTYMPIFLKAVSLSLSEVPILNASIDVENGSIIYHPSHNISIAMNTKEGLIVPNVKDVEKKSMMQIAEDLKVLGEIAKSGKFGTHELEGGTFALSNIGSIGGKTASPVVFPPQVCIGAIGSIQNRAIVDESGLVSVAQMLSISWAADHRIIDGATLAVFNKTWKRYMEHPESMLLNLK